MLARSQAQQDAQDASAGDERGGQRPGTHDATWLCEIPTHPHCSSAAYVQLSVSETIEVTWRKHPTAADGVIHDGVIMSYLLLYII